MKGFNYAAWTPCQEEISLNLDLITIVFFKDSTKLCIPNTVNTDYILWQLQLIVADYSLACLGQKGCFLNSQFSYFYINQILSEDTTMYRNSNFIVTLPTFLALPWWPNLPNISKITRFISFYSTWYMTLDSTKMLWQVYLVRAAGCWKLRAESLTPVWQFCRNFGQFSSCGIRGIFDYWTSSPQVVAFLTEGWSNLQLKYDSSDICTNPALLSKIPWKNCWS